MYHLQNKVEKTIEQGSENLEYEDLLEHHDNLVTLICTHIKSLLVKDKDSRSKGFISFEASRMLRVARFEHPQFYNLVISNMAQ